MRLSVLILLAACSKPQPLAREGFSLMVPAGWHVDTGEDDYNPDHNFAIAAPTETPAHAQFFLYDHPLDPKRRADDIAAALLSKHADGTRRDFQDWGHHHGQGADLRYSVDGHAMCVRVFVDSGQARSFVVLETVPVAYDAQLRPVFERLASSFQYGDQAPVAHERGL
jgi:hypothetical protein